MFERKLIVSPLGFEPTSYRILVGCDDHYYTTRTATVTMEQFCVARNVVLLGNFYFKVTGW